MKHRTIDELEALLEGATDGPWDFDTKLRDNLTPTGHVQTHGPDLEIWTDLDYDGDVTMIAESVYGQKNAAIMCFAPDLARQLIEVMKDRDALKAEREWVKLEDAPPHFYSHNDSRENNMVDLLLYSRPNEWLFLGRVFEGGEVWTNDLMADKMKPTHAMLPPAPPNQPEEAE